MKNPSAPVAKKLPTAEEPLPEFLGTPGMQLLRQLSRERWKADRDRLTAEQESLMREFVAGAERALVPAKPAVISEMLRALFWHYPAVQRPPEAAESIAKDWLRDLGHLPEDIVDAACTGWRRGKNEYAPTPGHLLAIGDPIFTARQHLLQLALRLVAPVGSVKAAKGGR